MSIDFQQALAAAVQQQTNTNTGKKTAEYWCNIGVHINDEQFVSIGGFPLDTITYMSGSSAYSATHNALVKLMLDKAKSLNPGDNEYIEAGQFQLQLKRTGGERTGTTTGAIIAPELAALFA